MPFLRLLLVGILQIAFVAGIEPTVPRLVPSVNACCPRYAKVVGILDFARAINLPRRDAPRNLPTDFVNVANSSQQIGVNLFRKSFVLSGRQDRARRDIVWPLQVSPHIMTFREQYCFDFAGYDAGGGTANVCDFEPNLSIVKHSSSSNYLWTELKNKVSLDGFRLAFDGSRETLHRFCIRSLID